MDEASRFLLIEKHDVFSVLYDTNNYAFPFVLIDNKIIIKRGMPETTKDLMDYKLRLFSSKELLEKFINCKGENEDELWNRPGI